MKSYPYETHYNVRQYTPSEIYVFQFVAAKLDGLATIQPEPQNISIPAACR